MSHTPQDYMLEIFGNLPRAGREIRSRHGAHSRWLPDSPRSLRSWISAAGLAAKLLELLQACAGRVIAVDLLPHMLRRLSARLGEHGLADRVQLVQADMLAMPFAAGSFDLVWSEGAIYLAGFERGLRRVRELVRPGGCVAVSEAVWLKPDPPSAARRFWQEYPEIDSIANKLKVISQLGYESIGHFVLPASSWTDPYYEPMKARIDEKRRAWAGQAAGQRIIDEALREISVFERHSDYYSYAFFVMRRPR